MRWDFFKACFRQPLDSTPCGEGLHIDSRLSEKTDTFHYISHVLQISSTSNVQATPSPWVSPSPTVLTVTQGCSSTCRAVYLCSDSTSSMDRISSWSTRDHQGGTRDNHEWGQRTREPGSTAPQCPVGTLHFQLPFSSVQNVSLAKCTIVQSNLPFMHSNNYIKEILNWKIDSIIAIQ